jgi:hypothetical protein
MSQLFTNVRPGDTVHYLTPQGQRGKGKAVLSYDTHVVVNRGKGQPQVVNDKNYVKHERNGKVVGALLSRLKEATWQGANDPYNWDPVMRQQVFAAAAKKNREKQKAKGQPVPHELETGRSYKPKYNPPPRRGTANEDSHDAEGKSARVAKTKRLKKKLHELNTSTLASYVSKAIADRKKAQGGFEMAGRIHTGERKKYFQDKMFAKVSKRTKGIQTAVGKIANNLPHEPLKAHADSESAKHGGWSGMEARESEWTANIQMAKSSIKTPSGHYLMRDGRKLSGPHSPEDAVKHYKALSAQGTDTKGVKIVHVKETHSFDVTNSLLSEAKVKEAAAKAISLSKKAKGNKHVDTEPKLDIHDKGGGGPMGGTHEGPEGGVDAKI